MMTFFLMFLVISLGLASAYLGMRLLEVKKWNAQIEHDLSTKEAEYAEKDRRFEAYSRKTSAQLTELKARVQRLSKWQGVADADAKAEELLEEARLGAAQQMAEAERGVRAQQEAGDELRHQANEQAEGIRRQALESAAVIKQEAQVVLATATTSAKASIQAAEAKAQEIAGEALTAKRNAEVYERTAKAMQNIIKGYGNEYLIPPQSLLDDLAEEVGYSEAGQELKRAREHARKMVKYRTAGQCAYVEASRRDTAIDFVVDAFNGKADSILSRVKADNAGTLLQELDDAFLTVNYNGKAFRDAQINQEYLTARKDELKWAAIAHQIKTEEREEQRRLKERIREEEKARKEIERAIRESAREEDLIRKAMEKAQAQLQDATAQQRADYEKQLAELSQRLQDAENRNQRAISMAQQTKRGHVYIISNVGSFGENVYKIGLTRRLDPLDRIRELGDASVPFEFDVHALILADDAPALESQLHKHFLMAQLNKVNHRKEFFRVDLTHIQKEIEGLGISVAWTMTAAARQYRETLVIEKIIQEDPQQREAWIQRQLQLESLEEILSDPEEEEVAA